MAKVINIGRKRFPADLLPAKFKHLAPKTAAVADKPVEKKKSGN